MACVLVAGTNGKGSTAALVAAMATSAGYRTGLFTSPFLEEIEEHIRVNGITIESRALADQIETVLDAGGSLQEPPTRFEALTATALLHFAAVACDLAIIEVGMGGRQDATNATEPILSLITSVALDHRDYFGSTLSEIAVEKTGVLRAGRPGLLGAHFQPEVESEIRSAAARLGANLAVVSERVWLIGVEPHGWAGQNVCLATYRDHYEMQIKLLGKHQTHNLMLAILAAETLYDLGWSYLTRTAIQGGAAGCHWPGRLEAIHLPSGGLVLLDAAHNPQGAESLADFLVTLGGSFDLLFGVLLDKDAAGMLAVLAPRAQRIFLTAPSGPRARDPYTLACLVTGQSFEIEPELEAAVERATANSTVPLVVCGSLLLVGEVRKFLRRRHGTPLPAVAPGYTLPAALDCGTL